MFIPTVLLENTRTYIGPSYRFMGYEGYIMFAFDIVKNQSAQQVAQQRVATAIVMDSYSEQNRGGISPANTSPYGFALYNFYNKVCGNPLFLLIWFCLLAFSIASVFVKGLIPVIAAAILVGISSFFLMCGVVGKFEMFRSILTSWKGFFLSLFVGVMMGVIFGVLGTVL